MRFTVKAKLASAFGVVILLSMIAGGVAYVKLSDMASTTEGLVAAAGRIACGAVEKIVPLGQMPREIMLWHQVGQGMLAD
jgi:methyl-accepting chemotaxis protein